MGSTPRLGRSPAGRNGNALQYSRRENPTDRGAWWATVQRSTRRLAQLSTQGKILTENAVIFHCVVALFSKVVADVFTYFLIFIWLHRVLIATCRIFPCGAQTVEMWWSASVLSAQRHSCPEASVMLVPQQNIESIPFALQGGFSATEPPRSPREWFLMNSCRLIRLL